MVDARTGQLFDYTRKRGVDHSEISLPVGAPAWMSVRTQLWNSIELIEKRKDSQLAREFDIAFPRELSNEDKIVLARRWVGELVSLGMAVDWNCHNLSGNNPHFHAMASMRSIELSGWGKKNRDWNDRSLIESWRARFAEMANEGLALWAAQKMIRALVDVNYISSPTTITIPHR